MQFRVLHVSADLTERESYVTGCFVPIKKTVEEKTLLSMITEEMNQINPNQQVTSNVVIKDGTVYFRTVEANCLFTVLDYLNKCLSLDLEYKLDPCVVFEGEGSKKIFEHEVINHKINFI